MARVLIFGTGSIGTVYTYILQQAKASVTAICRSNFAAASTSGLRLDSAKFGQGLVVKPTSVLRHVPHDDPHHSFDYVLVCTKSFPSTSAPSLIAPAVGPSTTIALIQNGVGIEAEYAAAFPRNPLLSCVAYLPSTQTAPGVVEMGSLERLEVGAYPASADTGPAEALAALLGSGGSECAVYGDVQPRRWAKLLVNAAWNPVCALTGCRDTEFLACGEGQEGFVREVMLEVVAVARALGYEEVNEKEAERQLGRATARTVGIEPSMLADVRSGRRMEVEAIVGNVVREGRRVGVPVVRLEALYALLLALDYKIGQ